MDSKTIRKKLNDKFDGISHKWIKFDLEEIEILEKVKLSIKDAINDKKITNFDARKIIKHFKRHEFIWLKFKSCSGRSHLICTCEVIDEKNSKIEVKLLPAAVLYADLLGGTPKGLKLFKLSKVGQSDIDWVKPDDGITDEIYPPIEEEMTRLGYELYKMTFLEKQGKLNEYVESLKN